MSSFGAYLLGFVLLVAGLAVGAYLLNVPLAWIAVGVLALAALGVLLATTRTRPHDRA